MSLTVVREALATAAQAVFCEWAVSPYEPASPDLPAAWVRFPQSTLRSDFAGSLSYDIPIMFAVGTGDDQTASERLNDVYDLDNWRKVEQYSFPNPKPYRQCAVLGTGEVVAVTVGEASAIAVDLIVRVIA